MPVNKTLISRKITLITRDLKNLREISFVPMAKYLKNDMYEALAERYLERVIGRVIDINYHILSAEYGESPLDYHDSFLMLAGKKILPYEFSEKIAGSAGLRNRLAHEYDEIDPKKVYRAVPAAMNDIPKYLKYIITFLDKKSKQRKLL